ncbi:MAG: ornithine cyclodeaminase family protein [Reichenbachiella sp.]|uniref:ornithine cyclodeaminase family protein n=1 Tax=Reichenbachiella sp. TaxID=2184521 RepID=UPI002967575E|nr:ornithine cyclodeaminase family protein [Reichenbachiella sp.]MDW3209449.1 ornithine cyclodeaminase family protein [Reichenbachiella sp.]
MTDFYSSEQISHLLSMKECITVMKELFSMDKDELINPLRSKMVLPERPVGIMGMMPAYIRPYQLMGIKVLSVFPENYKQGLSSHQGILHLFETKTGQLLASFDADEITAIRTAAVSGLMTDLLATKSATQLCLLGSGKQAEMHLAAISEIRTIQNVTVWSQDKSHAAAFCTKVRSRYKNINFSICETVEAATAEADIICTVTASRHPILQNQALKENVHINAVGACTPDARELSSELVLQGEVYIDNYLATTHEAGDLIIPAAEKGLAIESLIKSDIHELLKDPSSDHASKLTIFKSVGVAIEDLAAAYHCYKKLN